MSFFRLFPFVFVVLCTSTTHVAWSASPNTPKQETAPVDEARSRCLRGVELFNEGSYREALIEFQRAYEVSPNYKVLFNIGQTSVGLKDYPAGVAAFERYLRDGGDKIPAKRQKEVREQLQKARERVGSLKITSNVDGAEVVIDNAIVGRTPLSEPILVNAGRRVVSVSKDGGAKETRIVDVAGLEELSLTIDLVSPAKPPPQKKVQHPKPAQPPETPRTKATPPNTPMWVALFATAGLTAGAAVSGALTLRAKQDYENELDSFPGVQSKIDSKRDRKTTLALVTDIVGGAAVVGAGLTLYFGLSGSSQSDSASMQLRLSSQSVSLDGRF